MTHADPTHDDAQRAFDRAVQQGDVALARRLAGSVARLQAPPLRGVKVIPAHSWSPTYGGSAGWTSAKLYLFVRLPEGPAASFTVSLGLNHCEEHQSREEPRRPRAPSGTDVSVCIPWELGKPIRIDQLETFPVELGAPSICRATGTPCRTIWTSALAADSYLETMIEGGEEAVFARLELEMRGALARPESEWEGRRDIEGEHPLSR